MRDHPSPNFSDRALSVSMVVLHYTGMETAEAAIERLCDPEAQVSAHYVVKENGDILRLVPEEKRAWHAGRSSWRGETDVNSASIGIEIVNPGHEFGYVPFPKAQMDALIPLLADIVDRHGIDRRNVVGHSDVAPARKQDPGELFDWARLGKVGLALCRPAKSLTDPGWSDSGFLVALERFGYDVSDAAAAVAAFQRRFRPELIDGEIDGESRAILFRLLLEIGVPSPK